MTIRLCTGLGKVTSYEPCSIQLKEREKTGGILFHLFIYRIAASFLALSPPLVSAHKKEAYLIAKYEKFLESEEHTIGDLNFMRRLSLSKVVLRVACGYAFVTSLDRKTRPSRGPRRSGEVRPQVRPQVRASPDCCANRALLPLCCIARIALIHWFDQ